MDAAELFRRIEEVWPGSSPELRPSRSSAEDVFLSIRIGQAPILFLIAPFETIPDVLLRVRTLIGERSPAPAVPRMVSIEVGDQLFAFHSKMDWVNKAQSKFRDAQAAGLLRQSFEQTQDWLCIDAKGRVCTKGAEFDRAEKEGTYPVRVFTIGAVR